jgi:hypothetical protein
MPITHAKHINHADGADASLLQPSDWNGDHVGGFESPTTTTGDMIVRGSLGPDLAISGTSTADSGASPELAFDANDSTQWVSAVETRNGTAWIKIDLGIDAEVAAVRHVTGTQSQCSFVIQSSTDNGSWTTRYTGGRNDALDTGIQMLPLTVTARYWRAITTDVGHPDFQAWAVKTFNVYQTGSDVRLPIGSTGEVLTVAGGIPSWEPVPVGFDNPMTAPGDLIYENPAGAVDDFLGAGPYTGSGTAYAGPRITGLVGGREYTIAFDNSANHEMNWRVDSFATGGSTNLGSSSNTNSQSGRLSFTLTLPASATEIQIYTDGTWSWSVTNLGVTHTETIPDRLPIGSTGEVLTVAGGVPSWDPPASVLDSTAPSTQAFGDAADVGTATTAPHRDHKHAMPLSPVPDPATSGVGAIIHIPENVDLTTGKTVTGRSTNNGYVAGNAIDDNMSTYWKPDDGSAGFTWYKVDLGAPTTVGAFRIRCGSGNQAILGYEIRSSPDDSNWTTRYSSGSGWAPDSGVLSFTPASVRYWMLYPTEAVQSPYLSLYEFELFAGSPIWSALAPGSAGKVLAMGAGTPGWVQQTVRSAAGVPSGAPSGAELPLAFDSTATTGGLYIWSGAAWVKVSTIP